MAIIIRCVRGSGDRKAPSINDALIVTENDAVKRGKRWLDDNYYLAENVSSVSGEFSFTAHSDGLFYIQRTAAR